MSRPQLGRAMFVYKRSFDVESRSGHRAVVVDVTNVATVVVDIASKQQIVSTRPRKYLIKDYIIYYIILYMAFYWNRVFY